MTPPPTIERVPLSPAEFAAACRMLERRRRDLSLRSGVRTEEHDRSVSGAGALSKHRRPYAMAHDYTSVHAYEVGSMAADALVRAAQELGLWAIYHDAGTGAHLHVQGLPPGPAAEGWLELHGLLL